MHGLTRGGVLQPRVLHDGKSVKVGALENRRARAIAQDANYSPAELQHLYAGKLAEFLRDDTAGALLCHAELGVLMQVLVQGFLPLRSVGGVGENISNTHAHRLHGPAEASRRS